jgi:hypothetical protein
MYIQLFYEELLLRFYFKYYHYIIFEVIELIYHILYNQILLKMNEWIMFGEFE